MAFIGITAILITASASIQDYATVTEEHLEGWDTVGGLTYNMWTPTSGRTVTPNDTQIDTSDINNPYHTLSYHYDDASRFYAFAAPYGESHDVRVFVFRNSSDYHSGSDHYWEQAYDFFLVTRTQNWWFWTVPRVAVVPFTTLIAHKIDNNRSSISVMLDKTNVTLFVSTTNTTGSLASRLYQDDNYTIGIGTRLGEALGSASMWTVLGQLLTMRLPDTHPVIQLVLAIPFWAGLGFMAITIVSRFIPFISGG